ncbi:hypothetical protein XENTR_v10014230 [Xenopus tropicalis]|nr:hypothetical protein XENTR_v10014230 [Xenopus tropicalis]
MSCLVHKYIKHHQIITSIGLNPEMISVTATMDYSSTISSLVYYSNSRNYIQAQLLPLCSLCNIFVI